MRTDDNGAEGIDGADGLLPPPREMVVDPDDKLWHTSSFAAITDEPPAVRKRKLTVGLASLGVATVAVCTFAGVEVTGIAGLTPPSPPRYVINEQASSQFGHVSPPAQSIGAAPLPAAPPDPPVAEAHPRVTQALGAARTRDDQQDDRSDTSGKKKAGHRKHKTKSDD